MTGRLNRDQKQLFYVVDLDDPVPDDCAFRQIMRELDLSWVLNILSYHYLHTGRPSIEPELMLRMLIFANVYAIRSEN